uniref:CSON000663 protein n=1 Tax=Culicoides sonorensis TaxID=179676 RepID=A0A336MIY3_CULSO
MDKPKIDIISDVPLTPKDFYSFEIIDETPPLSPVTTPPSTFMMTKEIAKKPVKKEKSTLYEMSLKIMTRNFINERNAQEKERISIEFNGILEFKQKLWPFVKPHIKQEIAYDDESNIYSWIESDLQVTDMNRFVLIQDKAQKKCIGIDDLKNKKLHTMSFGSDPIACFVQVYGNKIQKLDQYEAAKKQLMCPTECDRGGAATNSATFELAKKLKEIHGRVIWGQEVAWFQFANFILASEAHVQTELTESLPPPHIMRFFSLASENPIQQNISARRTVELGKRVNKGMRESISALSQDVDILIDHHRNGLSMAQALKTKILAIKDQIDNNDYLMDGLAMTVETEITEFTQELKRGITDMEDVDHQDPVDP